MADWLLEQLFKRESELQDSKIIIEAELNTTCQEITIRSNRVMCLRQLEIYDGQTLLQGERTSSLADKGRMASHPECEFLAKWVKGNDYWYRVRFDKPTYVTQVLVTGDTRFASADWLFYSNLITDDSNENKVTLSDYAYNRKLEEGQVVAETGAYTKTEVELVLNCMYRKHPGRSFNLFRKYSGTKITTDMIATAASPSALTPHGYRIPLGHTTKKSLAANLTGFIDDFGVLGYDIFVTSGTLLGAVRDGSFIPHDDDVDFAIVLKSEQMEDVVDEILMLENTLREKGLVRDRAIYDNPRFHWKLKYVNGTSMDLFPCWISDGKVYAWPYCFGALERNDLLPLGTAKINGESFPAPRDANRFLDENYGKSWATPDPMFKFDWDKAMAAFDEFLKELKAKGIASSGVSG